MKSEIKVFEPPNIDLSKLSKDEFISLFFYKPIVLGFINLKDDEIQDLIKLTDKIRHQFDGKLLVTITGEPVDEFGKIYDLMKKGNFQMSMVINLMRINALLMGINLQAAGLVDVFENEENAGICFLSTLDQALTKENMNELLRIKYQYTKV